MEFELPSKEFHDYFVGSERGDYPNYFGIKPKLWEESELLEEFAYELDRQRKFYDPKFEWENGYVGFPNAVGGLRMCIVFDDSYKRPRGDDLYQVDPRPRPWMIAFRDESGRARVIPNGFGRKNYYTSIEDARKAFVLTALEIMNRVDVSGTTADTPRIGICDNCKREFDFDHEKQNYGNRGANTERVTDWSARPHLTHDDVVHCIDTSNDS